MNSVSNLCQINLICLRGRSYNQDRIMIGKKPVITCTSFTVLKPTGNNFAYIFFDTYDLVTAVHKFFIDTLWKDANVPKIDSEIAACFIRDMFPVLLNSKSNKDYLRPRSVSMRTVPLNSSI